ncbi:hypothetical protein AWB83_03240 [Caballeronia ptereochthonis]|uniref:Uncharacterized protein n=1 Tax=Caballeronia ptereochthonis TaxID=1777144 RepID=A0A158BGX7_9BURK|nr:hypothetical protein AWB83_03240 [Caballeronia ptereochthonis]
MRMEAMSVFRVIMDRANVTQWIYDRYTVHLGRWSFTALDGS